MIIHELQQQALEELLNVCNKYSITMDGSMNGYVVVTIGDFDPIYETVIEPDVISAYNDDNETIILVSKESD